MQKLLNAAEVATVLGVAQKTARKYMRDMVTVRLPGGDIRVEEPELTRWICARRQQTSVPAGKKPEKTRSPRVYDPDLFEPDGRIKRRHSTR